MRHTPENVTELADGEVFVFGSNLAGRHGAGAAKTAHDSFGAEYGVGEGMTGRCYAFPTLDEKLSKRSIIDLSVSADTFRRYVEAFQDKTFLVTRVGTGLAGYKEHEIKSLFKGLPSNVILPEGWKD